MKASAVPKAYLSFCSDVCPWHSDVEKCAKELFKITSCYSLTESHPWPKVSANVTYSFNLSFKLMVRTRSGKWRLPLLLPKEHLDYMISQLSLSVSMLPGWLLSTYLTWHTPCEWPLYLLPKQEPTPDFCSNIYVPQIKVGQGLLFILIKSFKNCLLPRFYLDLPRCSLNEGLSIFLLRVLTL